MQSPDYTRMTATQVRAMPDFNTNYWAIQKSWLLEKAALAKAKDAELSLRCLLAELTFPDPQEGTNTHMFGAHKKAPKLVLKYPINRNVDQAAIVDCIDTLRETIGAKADYVVKREYKLVLGEYRDLDDAAKAILSPAITATPGTPQLEFVEGIVS
jgi:hypothetical protein